MSKTHEGKGWVCELFWVIAQGTLSFIKELGDILLDSGYWYDIGSSEFTIGFVAFIATMLGGVIFLEKLGHFAGLIPAAVEFMVISTLYAGGETVLTLVLVWALIGILFIMFFLISWDIEGKND